MSNEQPLGGSEPLSWQTPDAPTIGTGYGPQATTPGGAPGPGSPKKSWPYVVLIAVSLTLLAVSGTVIALSLADRGDQVTTNAEEATPTSRKTTTARGGSGDGDDATGEGAASDAEADDTSVTLAERTSPTADTASGQDPGQPDAPEGTNPETGGPVGTYAWGDQVRRPLRLHPDRGGRTA